MCESPLSLTEDEASKLYQLSVEKKLLFAVSFPYCYFAMVRYVLLCLAFHVGAGADSEQRHRGGVQRPHQLLPEQGTAGEQSRELAAGERRESAFHVSFRFGSAELPAAPLRHEHEPVACIGMPGSIMRSSHLRRQRQHSGPNQGRSRRADQHHQGVSPPRERPDRGGRRVAWRNSLAAGQAGRAGVSACEHEPNGADCRLAAHHRPCARAGTLPAAWLSRSELGGKG